MKTRAGHHETSCLPLGPWLGDLYPAPTWISALLAEPPTLNSCSTTVNLKTLHHSYTGRPHHLSFLVCPFPRVYHHPLHHSSDASHPTMSLGWQLCHSFPPPGSHVHCPRCKHWGRCTLVRLSIQMPFWGEKLQFLSDHSQELPWFLAHQ